ncbi:MAG: hypothetical protein GQ558_10450 [Thermoplasmata archaeon]|nr:hypothetical protein [Thermoplasmata archaeon]
MKGNVLRKSAVWATFLVLVISLGLVAIPTAAEDARVHVTGNNTWIVGNYGDNFVYDGVGYTPTSGFLNIDVSEEANTGIVVATWEATDYYGHTGTFTAIIDEFMGEADWMAGGITSGIAVHGDTGRGPPVLPTVYAYLAGYGLGDVYVNGVLMWEDLDAHFMITEGTRDKVDRAVWNADGSGYYSPMAPSDGKVFPNEMVTHIVLHSTEEDTGNFPAFTEFFHINYENIGKTHVTGTNTRIVGNYGDNFVYDGDGYEATSGFVTINVNDVTNTGAVVATWEATDYYGYSGVFTAVINEFMGEADWMDGGITQGIYAHGDTGRGPPVLPTMYAYIAGYGVGDVYVDGVLVWEDLDAHFMVTEGTRDPVQNKVWNADGTGLFSPMAPADGKVFSDTLLTHVVLHSMEEDTNNFPAFTEFFHINYETTSTSAVDVGVLVDQRLAPLQTDLEMAKLRVTDLEMDLLETEDAIMALETDLVFAGVDISDLQAALAEAMDAIDQLEMDLEMANEDIESNHDEIHDVQEVIVVLQDAIVDLVDDLDMISADLLTAEESIADLETELADGSTRLDDLDTNADDTNTRVNQLEDDTKTLDNDVSGLSTIGYAAVAIAIIALLVAVVAVVWAKSEK